METIYSVPDILDVTDVSIKWQLCWMDRTAREADKFTGLVSKFVGYTGEFEGTVCRGWFLVELRFNRKCIGVL